MARSIAGGSRVRLAVMLIIASAWMPGIGHAVIRDARIPATDEKMVKWITAARDGDLAAVKALLEGGMDINARDSNGDPALSWAAFNGRTEAVKYLLDKGADATLKNTSGRWGANYTPLVYAVAGGHVELVNLLYEKVVPKLKEDASYGGIRNFAFRVAVINGRKELREFFLEQGADVNATSESGRTALMEATVSLNGDTIKYLLDKGADVRAKAKDGVTALHMAAVRGWIVPMVTHMVEKGAEVNARTAKGETPLYWALMSATGVAAVPYLLAKGADVNAADGQGVTPLMLAVRGGKADVVKLLLDRGADATAKAANGDTALKLAGDKKEIAELLRQRGAEGAAPAPAAVPPGGAPAPAAAPVAPAPAATPSAAPPPPPAAAAPAAPTPSPATDGAAPKAPAGMSLIPAGRFRMGDNFETGPSDQTPVHVVHVSAFYMDKCKVTYKLWDEVLTWAKTKGYTDTFARAGRGEDYPVVELTWYDAVKWCNARSEKEGLTPVYYTTPEKKTIYRTGKLDISSDCVRSDADGYRLPTEAEWEKAARGGSEGKRFPWGDSISHEQANYSSGGWPIGKVPDYDVNPTRGRPVKFKADREPFTSPVGSFPPNGYGLFDMAGNAWDWVWDWWARDYYKSSPDTDPKGPEKEKAHDGVKLLRGGSWYAGADLARCSMRGNNRVPDTRTQNIGFRCARTAKAEPDKK